MSDNYYNSNPYNHPDYEKDNHKDNKILKIMLIIFLSIIFSPIIVFLLKTLFYFSIITIIVIVIILVLFMISGDDNTYHTYNYYPDDNKEEQYYPMSSIELEQRKDKVLNDYYIMSNNINTLIQNPAFLDKNIKEYDRFNNAINNIKYSPLTIYNIRELEDSWNILVMKTRNNGLNGLTQSQKDIAYRLYNELLELDNDPVMFNHKLLELVNIVTMVHYDNEMLSINPYELLKNVDN